MSDTLPLPFNVSNEHIGPGENGAADAPLGSPHGAANPEITRLPPSRLDNCSRCYSDCEIAPRQREVYRLVNGTLLCRSCYQREKRT